MSFVLKSSEFLTAAVRPPGYPPTGPPELAFAGRSNVGKSSLINKLLGRKKLVRVSSTPGRTQEINFFALNDDEIRLVDLPGYGFAKVSKKVRAGWRTMVESYLASRDTLRGVVVILDIRREPKDEDLMLLDYLKAHGIPIIIAVTKADKLSGNKRRARLSKLLPRLTMYDPEPTPVSAMTGLGKDKMWERLLGLI